MGFFARLFGRASAGAAQASRDAGSEQQAVLIYVKLAAEGLGDKADFDRCVELEDQLEAAIEHAQAGEFDGDEFGAGYCTVYTYGPDADRLFAALSDVLRVWAAPAGSYVVKRYGEPGAREERIDL